MNRLWQETEGQDVAEYAIMLAVVLVIVIGMVRMIGTNASTVFSQVGSAVSSRRVRLFRNVGSLKLILKRRTCLRKRVAIFAFCTTILFVSISPSQAQQDQSDARARKMLTKVVPIYPSLAQRMCIAGSVKIEVLVAPNGSAKSTQILGGHALLVQAD